MTMSRQVIENPLSGERIVIRRNTPSAGSDSGEDVLSWELFLSPGGSVPSGHAHPEQEEKFTILSGRLKFRVGGRAMTLRRGDSVAVPPGTVHSFANKTKATVHVLVETTPALDMAELLETAAAIAREQQSASRPFPRLLDLALFMSDFEREVRAPYLPRPLVQLVMRSLAWFARSRGLDARYRGLRAGHQDVKRVTPLR